MRSFFICSKFPFQALFHFKTIAFYVKNCAKITRNFTTESIGLIARFSAFIILFITNH